MNRRGRSLKKFFQGLENGDPVAYGMVGILVLILIVAGVIWLVDRKKQRNERTGGKGSRTGW